MANICALLGLLLLVHWGHCVDVSNIFVFYNNTYEYGKQYKIHINSSAEYVFEYAQTEFLDAEFPARITVSSPSVTRSYPVFITARQQKGALSWQLPLVVGLQEHLSISRTLCPNKNFFLQSAQPNVTSHDVVTQNHPIIHITTSSSRNLTLFLKVDLVEDFYLKINTAKNITTSPSEPIVYYYSFEYGALDGVLDLEHIGSRTNVTTTQTKDGNYKLKVPGDSSRYDSSPSLVPPRDDDFTRYLYNPARDAPGSPGSLKDGEEATSNYSSPVWDLARNVLRASIFNGINESLKTVVIRLDSNDDTCMLISIQNASCPVFDTERDIAYEGFYATISRSGGITVSQRRYPLGFYIVLLVRASDAECSGSSDLSNFARFFDWKIEDFAWSKPGTRPRDRAKNVRLRIIPSITYQQYWVAIVVALAAIFSVYLVFLVGLTCFKSKPRTMETLDQAEIESTTRENGTSIISSPTTACSALDIATANYGIRRGSYSSLGEAGESGEVFLSELCTKDNKALSQRSSMFLWTLLTVAVFYGLPVVQLVITYQRVLNQTGNQDQCYYNFLCAHPLGLLSDFNHVYSNLGYVMLGALFLLFVWRKHRLHTDPNFDKLYGIPPHYGIYYAMGVALMMEGVLSGSYHVCPNHTNFQFDTSFMYVMAVLCMVKIYQTRHPDINARAHGTFGVLACAVFIGLIGVLYPNFYFWVIFTFIHIGTCLVLTLQVYYLGRLRFTWGCCSKCVCGGLCRPAYRGRCVLVLLANLCNWALAAWGLYRHSKDFATHLLYIFLMNLALHLFWYLAMKLLHRERIVWPAAALLLIGSVTWGGALYFFFDNSTSWALTPAQSRSFNTGCGLLSFYDNHDVWHFLSAAAMFFSFMLLLVIDDDLAHSPRHKIPVF